MVSSGAKSIEPVDATNTTENTTTRVQTMVTVKSKQKTKDGKAYTDLKNESDDEAENAKDKTNTKMDDPEINGQSELLVNSLTESNVDNPAYSLDKTLDASISKTNTRNLGSGFIDVPKEIKHKQQQTSYLLVFHKVKFIAVAVFLVLFITFLMFPGASWLLCSEKTKATKKRHFYYNIHKGLVVGIQSQYSSVNDNDWMPVIMVTVYNLGDYFGRQFLASWTSFGFTPKTLWIGCIWRFWMYPVFLIMYNGWWNNDIAACLIMFVFSASNGHFCCLCFIWANQIVEPFEKELTLNLMTFALVFGISVGSFMALAISELL
ncbi:hypothetical protein RFI_25420 [Reticulomyxa filosa]|uniref:Uncharacterized protein n=1 Tax=Reticulomyxa filosa TaxID=46433 RepID=X6MG02_RETFI|nr:hypothetical protein RFI_25420 [Reticulomyxa filosa]|eukprot:ETO11960.1 hypothetical protein RFI_25420 [Reticulomyxa filosa]